MAPVIGLTHRTSYRYDRPVQLGPQSIRLRPMPDTRAPLLSYSLRVEPEPASIHWQHDALGNRLARVVMPGPVSRLDVIVELLADLAPADPFDFLIEPEASQWPFAYAAAVADDLAAFRRPDHAGPLLAAMRDATAGPAPTVAKLLELNRRVRDGVAYITRMDPGVWDADLTLRQAQGSCRDSAWVLIQLLRLHGIAARFVSGYLVQLASGERAADSADLHAWAEAYLPGAGWIGLDPTSGLLAAEGHLPLAASPHPIQAAPVTGTVEPSGVKLETELTVWRPAA